MGIRIQSMIVVKLTWKKKQTQEKDGEKDGKALYKLMNNAV